MKSKFPLEQSSQYTRTSSTLGFPSLAQRKALEPHFHEFYVYTDSSCDLPEDEQVLEVALVPVEDPDMDSDTESKELEAPNALLSSSDFYIDLDGRVCLKPDSALWEQVRFGDRLCAERVSLPHSEVDGSPAAPVVTEESSESWPGKDREAPTQVQANAALTDLKNLLSPARKTGRGRIDPKLDPYTRKQMESMQTMLNFYVNSISQTYDSWGASSLQAAVSLGRGYHCARKLRVLNRQFIHERTLLPVNPFGDWNECLLVDEDLTNDISNKYLFDGDRQGNFCSETHSLYQP